VVHTQGEAAAFFQRAILKIPTQIRGFLKIPTQFF
jgi:hypothetical protein